MAVEPDYGPRPVAARCVRSGESRKGALARTEIVERVVEQAVAADKVGLDGLPLRRRHLAGTPGARSRNGPGGAPGSELAAVGGSGRDRHRGAGWKRRATRAAQHALRARAVDSGGTRLDRAAAGVPLRTDEAGRQHGLGATRDEVRAEGAMGPGP